MHKYNLCEDHLTRTLKDSRVNEDFLLKTPINKEEVLSIDSILFKEKGGMKASLASLTANVHLLTDFLFKLS